MYSSAIPKMKSTVRKPPLPSSPKRLNLRLRRDLQLHSLQTPAGSLAIYKKQPPRSVDIEESCALRPEYKKQPPRSVDIEESCALRPEYRAISCELRALEKMVRDEFGNADSEIVGVFERGKFYDEYSARRNERLKRKKGMIIDEGKPAHAHGLGVTIESAKKGSSRKLGSMRKSVSAAYSMEMEGVSETPRYMPRSMSKENKKPPLPAASSVLGEKRKIGAKRVGKFYDEYSARRNERLKRKKGMIIDEGKPAHAHGLGVTIESAKKGSSRKLGSMRKSVSAAYSMEMEGVSETPRYMPRSMSKENKKPPLPAASSVLGEKRKIWSQKSRENLKPLGMF